MKLSRSRGVAALVVTAALDSDRLRVEHRGHR